MQTLAQKFLTAAERKRVTETVRKAEQITSGEVVVMIVSRSHSYPAAAITGSVFLALPSALLLTSIIGPLVWLGSQNLWLFLTFFALLYLLFLPLLNRSDTVKRFFLNPKQVKEEVERSAITAFFSEQLYKTERENGILLYISVMEKKVWILADRGINERIEQPIWDDIIVQLTKGIKEQKRCEAICEAVKKTGKILEVHLPIREDDRNELHNIIIR
ncbi:MAG: TPM domain-containing protein [Deltaproteobacteria bacterium]|nr:TPM domain-containing protein [Deltaproteobacteria bacterium]